MARESMKTSEQPAQNDVARAYRDAGTAFTRGVMTAPFTAPFDAYWGGMVFGLRLWQQMVNASLGTLTPPSDKNQKKD